MEEKNLTAEEAAKPETEEKASPAPKKKKKRKKGGKKIFVILIVVLLGCAVSLFGGGSGSNAYTPVSAEVEAYEPLIQKYAKQYGIPEYVELIKAVMMQESGGRGLDPMQAA